MSNLSFNSNGSILSATLHAGSASHALSRRPGIVVIGSWLTVKEQMPEHYARRLADAGYVALTFDFRGFGSSAGSPREVESGKSKAEDILNAAAFLRTRPEVDPERIGVLAICASASYTALALQGVTPETSPVKAVAMVAPWIHDAEIVAQLYGGDDAVRERLRKAQAARGRYAVTGEVEYVKAASNQDTEAAMYQPGNALDYYLSPRRGAIPEWGGRFALMAWTEWLQTDFVGLAAGFTVPLCVVTGPGTATPSGVQKFVAGLKSRPEVIAKEGTQFDFYDQPDQVDFACACAVAHFQNTLS